MDISMSQGWIDETAIWPMVVVESFPQFEKELEVTSPAKFKVRMAWLLSSKIKFVYWSLYSAAWWESTKEGHSLLKRDSWQVCKISFLRVVLTISAWLFAKATSLSIGNTSLSFTLYSVNLVSAEEMKYDF